MNTALSLAIENGDIIAVLDILNKNPDLINFQQDGDFKTPLHISVENKQEEITKTLLEHNANVTLQDSDGNTPLHLAAWDHNLKMTEMLLSHGNAIVDMQNNEGQTPLHLASARPRAYQSVSDLLSKESLSVAQALLTHNANVNLQDNDGNTALHYATRHFHHLEMTEMLLNYGANVNEQNNVGDTAAHRAAKRGILPTVTCLLQNGANVHLKGENGNSVLHCAAQQSRGPNVKIVKAVLHHGADVNARNNDGSTPLHHAAEKMHIPLPAIQLLLKHGADINAHDSRGCTPLSNAISCSSITNVQTGVPEFFTSHITKLEYSSDKKTNSACELTNQQLIQQSLGLSEYKLACEKELQELRSIKVGSSKSMLSAFLTDTTDDNELSRYTNDPTVQKVYECCEEKFPIYSGDIKEHIDAGSTRNRLLHGALESMDDICKEQPKEHSTESRGSWTVIPSEVKLNILKHLSNEDLSKIQQDKKSEAKKKDTQPSGHRCI